jgi:hypothetical protein
MNDHFLLLGYTQTVYQQLYALRYDERIIDEYIDNFYQLITRNDIS